MKDLRSRYLAEKTARTKLENQSESGLRARQKQFAKEEILAAGLTLFSRHGYVKTTMQMIAEAADMGVATVFRIFGTKAAVFAALVERDLEEILDEGWDIVLNPRPSLTDTTLALVKANLKILEKPSKSIRTPSHLWPAVVVGRPEMDKVVKWADDMTMIQFYGVLTEFEKKYNVKLPFDNEDMAVDIFYIFNGHYAAYLAAAKKNPQNLVKDLDRRLSIILPGLSE